MSNIGKVSSSTFPLIFLQHKQEKVQTWGLWFNASCYDGFSYDFLFLKTKIQENLKLQKLHSSDMGFT